MTSDQALGTIGFTAALFIWLYYTAWVILAPFVDPKVEWFHALFPPVLGVSASRRRCSSSASAALAFSSASSVCETARRVSTQLP